MASHSAYWAIDEGLGVREGNGRPDHYQSAADHYQAHYEQRLLVPQPAKFVEHAKRGLLGQLSVVAVNLAVLRLEGDHTVYGGPVQVNRELLGHFGNIAASAS